MITLVINTTNSKEVILVLKRGEEVFEEKSVSSTGRAESILNLLQRALEKCGEDLKSIEMIFFEKGPGSYTGLKAGVAVANALSFALNIPVNDLPIGKLEIPVYE